MEKIEVILRTRPLSLCELSSKETMLPPPPILSTSDFPAESRHKHSTLFDLYEGFQFFSPETKTQEIYEKIVKKYVFSWIQGINVSLFMYGQTGTGKTYTFLGDEQRPGLLGLVMGEIMKSAQNLEKNMKNAQNFEKLQCSYLEIYNDNIYDLLSKDVGVSLGITEDAVSKEFFIRDLVAKDVKSLEEVMGIVEQGEKNRHYAETICNHCSSRSHTLFRIFFKKNYEEWCFFNFVDLAGSERIFTGAEETKIQSNTNKKKSLIPETKAINKSLFFLTHVITFLAKGQTGMAAPFRNSPLTKLLRSSLSGEAKVLMILCLNPCNSQIDQTLNTLRFGWKARKVQTLNNVEKTRTRKFRKSFLDSIDQIKELNEVLENREKEIKEMQFLTNRLCQMVLFYQNKNPYGLCHLDRENLKLVETDVLVNLTKQKEQEAYYNLDMHEEVIKGSKNLNAKAMEDIRFFNEEFFQAGEPSFESFFEQRSTVNSLDEFL